MIKTLLEKLHPFLVIFTFKFIFMKTITTLCLFATLFLACNTKKSEEATPVSTTIPTDNADTEKPTVMLLETKKYANDRFRKVTVEKVAEHKFRIQGEAQVFEANINWSVEDGHKELKKGFTTATIGAPEWGKFDFTVEAEKKKENSTLQLVLFERSMKDGSRQYELAIVLE